MSAPHLALPILALTLGHIFSNAVRTIPAVAADVLTRDLGITEETLAALTGAFPAAFALVMLPVGVALDRYGVRRTALGLLSIGTAGALIAALAPGPLTMLLGQVVLGIGCSGALMCPTTYAARAMDARRFALWSGLILALGNMGMLLSASPLALLIEWQGWRAGFLAAAAMAAVAVLAVALTVERDAPQRAPGTGPSLAEDVARIWHIATSPALRPLLVFGFASLAAMLGLRGLWGGPWLMEVKGLDRVQAGNILLLCTVALVAGPAIAGWVHRAVGRTPALLAGSHYLAAALMLLLLAGGPGAPLSAMLGLPMLPPAWDTAVLVLFGLIISFQVLCFSLVRAAVPPEQAGRALSAHNITFFAGAAVLQAASGVAAGWGGVAAAILTFPAALILCTTGFLWLRRRAM
ncbi:MAG: MFS transporter [Acetobacteraceae bacterium]|nr:MFS transporter [Acetobacteraceae bacterium]